MNKWNQLRKMSPEAFAANFGSDAQCLAFLAAVKWSKGYTCRKCGHPHYCNGKTPYARRCTRCKAEESARAHTIFHACKIDLAMAFRMIYTVCKQPGISTYQLSDAFALRQMTCCKFKQKIRKCQESGHFDWMSEAR